MVMRAKLDGMHRTAVAFWGMQMVLAGAAGDLDDPDCCDCPLAHDGECTRKTMFPEAYDVVYE